LKFIYGLMLFSALAGSLSAQATEAGTEIPTDPATDAWAIAVRNLWLNTITVRDPNLDDERQILVAGRHHYRMLWARDFSTATPGALIAGQYRTVKDTLETLIHFQRENGHFPRTVDNMSIQKRVVSGLLGIFYPFRAPLRGWYLTEYKRITIDQNILIAWSAGEYIAATKDLEFARKHLPAIERGLDMVYKGYWVDGLVGNQPPFSDWQDSIKRTGRVALSNIKYNLAMRRLAEWTGLLGMTEKSEDYLRRAAEHRERFEEYFYLPEKKMIRNFEGDDTHLAADANLLAVVHGMISREHALEVMNTMRASPLWKPIPGRATWPSYPAAWKGRNLKLAGISDYFDRMHWSWISAIGARAEKAVGNCEGYHNIMRVLNRRISEFGTIHEVYDLLRDGQTVRPVKRPLYRSERPFTWASGMYLEAAADDCDSE